MRLQLTILLLLALFPAACARRDPTVDGLLGSEPQRLSFGPPSQVAPSFVQKMKLCWFSGKQALLTGYRYETGDRPPEDADGARGSMDGYQDIKIFEGSGGAELFEVQFHKYNENTLIVTRNVSLPSELLTKVNRDIQLWTLNGTDCSGL